MARKDNMMCLASRCAWAIVALAAINVGMSIFEFNFFQCEFFIMNFRPIAKLIFVVIGLSGVYSLACLFMKCQSKGKC